MKARSFQLVAASGLFIALLACYPSCVVAQTAEQLDFFETHVRPVLYEHCLECHGPETQWSDFRVDSREAILRGGEQGAAIVPHSLTESPLVAAIRRNGDLQMPPDDPLTEGQIAAIERWIEDGAVWPEESSPAADEEARRRQHWAFQPIQQFSAPAVHNHQWVSNQVDAFVLSKLEQANLQPAPQADRRTLVRRLYFDLTGLPPTFQEVQRWERSTNPDWYSELVEQLLESPEYGERWGRLWLDVARYSDTKGYVYAREEKNYIHAYVYRDWIIDAFRRDLPFDEFVMYQLAADQVTEAGSGDRAAMGYLTLGRRFLGVSHDIIDDRIDVVTRGLMGLTVGCARCHDHKYDPISAEEYYSLYGVFLNSTEEIERLTTATEQQPNPAWEEEYSKRKQAYDEAMMNARQTAATRMREKIRDYFVAQAELEKYPQEGFDVILSTEDLIPNLVRRLQLYLISKGAADDRRFIAWREYASIDPKQFAEQAKVVWQELRELDSQQVHPRIAALFPEPPQSFRQVAESYGQLFAEVYQASQKKPDDADTEQPPSADSTLGVDDEELQAVLFGNDAVCELPDELMYSIEGLFDSGTCNEIWRLQGELDRWILQPGVEQRFAVILRDRKQEYAAQVFRRGNPAQRSAVIQREMLSVAGPEECSLDQGSGRLQLAEAIVHPDNPLTPRVWVNRIWKEHFGEGLVRTPSDFGLRAENPSHPELLDWLAVEFMKSGWSTKKLHRLMVNSSTYKQAGRTSHDAAVRELGQTIDPDNRMLWHMAPRRLTFEEMRDSMLMLSDKLERKDGGRAEEIFASNQQALPRTLYGFIDRQFVPNVLRMFDFANPDLHAPGRSETAVPQQSLFSLNHPFVAECASALVASLQPEKEGEESAREELLQPLFEKVLQRSPNEHELRALIQFVEQAAQPQAEIVPPASLAWSYGYGPLTIEEVAADAATENANNQLAQLQSFTPLPHFTGNAWQGGSAFPDGALGWLQLTAAGGHPGNTLEHAVVRRWTAPKKMRVSIESLVEHQEAAGDGIRCWVLLNGNKTLAKAEVHQSNWAWNAEAVELNAGDTLDFVVDILQQLNTDQYLWQVKITALVQAASAEEQANDEVADWDSRRDFVGPPTMKLDVMEQLAQVLLICNEATFIE